MQSVTFNIECLRSIRVLQHQPTLNQLLATGCLLLSLSSSSEFACARAAAHANRSAIGVRENQPLNGVLVSFTELTPDLRKHITADRNLPSGFLLTTGQQRIG